MKVGMYSAGNQVEFWWTGPHPNCPVLLMVVKLRLLFLVVEFISFSPVENYQINVGWAISAPAFSPTSCCSASVWHDAAKDCAMLIIICVLPWERATARTLEMKTPADKDKLCLVFLQAAFRKPRY
ncbi:hypothetical protein YC2023_088783 [Brassica napus]